MKLVMNMLVLYPTVFQQEILAVTLTLVVISLMLSALEVSMGVYQGIRSLLSQVSLALVKLSFALALFNIFLSLTQKQG